MDRQGGDRPACATAHGESRLEHLLFGEGIEELIRTMPSAIMPVTGEQKPREDERLKRNPAPALAMWKE